MLFLTELLKKTGAEILTAGDGKEALEICRNNPEIDLVLMDIKLPIMDGYTAARKIKQYREQLPIIAHTAYALPHDREKALRAGCSDYIAKPVQKKEMLDLVIKYL